ncbi:Predicted flavoprotein CzcO associated with the cation diffusion facilitator CzcD [Nannocystis exedens]|uniref:Predicted flavoprotein CzcO associated with the cation diffusion facilitator CzcD n=1 Tax=Nannocystis exedens TaxID=54 RepID=A0A1I1ZYS8_9BACT|nr:NAD(P)/FAD-dependent oxidoreductase [Nannocystis exedens]PCC75226.1 4-hydroxyacetophenone monooxygenase [Nannocystis exedens]SFE36821.1 Predicted flavoprotein CzcO associated with the cation diffusion facilitator CzcD [Nannocystis exedens]
MSDSAASAPRDVDVVIVGAGFSGLCMAIQLRRVGITDFVVLEKADRVGGTWRDNTYPGAACDIPSHLYSYSFEQNPNWTRAFPLQSEIQQYLERCADKYDVRRHIRFGAEVDHAEFDRAAGRWHVRTRAGERLSARALVLGNGALHLPAYPELRGLDTFAGKTFHSARWDHGYDLSQKTVAVIGTGASAIQFVPQIAPVVQRLHLFQRTPAWVVPKPDHPIGELARRVYARVPALQRLVRNGLYWQHEARAFAFLRPKVMRLVEPLARKHVQRQIADPGLRARLSPDYRMGCKRVLISNDFYPALTRPNVELVTDPIDRVEPTGVRTQDGALREVDAIILGTGFRATEYLSAVRIVGVDGQELNERWRGQPETYLGITVSGFPNLYLLMGPGTGLGHNSMIFMIEAQVRYALQCIATLRDRNLRMLDVRPEVQTAFASELYERLGRTVWSSGCKSWYQTADGRAAALWPGFTVSYWLRTRQLDLRDYQPVA